MPGPVEAQAQSKGLCGFCINSRTGMRLGSFTTPNRIQNQLHVLHEIRGHFMTHRDSRSNSESV